MPYTPPSQQSPAASGPSSPVLSRSHSYLKGQSQSLEQSPSSGRSGLPRSSNSSSYLSKHRRSPSITQTDGNIHTSLSNGDSSGNGYDSQSRVDPYGSLRQSPPPKTNMLIPTGATISPPESSHNSSDDEESNNGRGRNLENLAELQAAISILQQRKESSPNRGNEESTRARLALDLVVPQLEKSLSTPNNTSAESSRSPLSREARKISHSRSSTDSNIVLDLGRQRQSPTQFGPADDGTEEEDSDESVRRSKPPCCERSLGN